MVLHLRILSRCICFPKSGWVSPDLCEAGVNTACDGSRIPATRVTSQAVSSKLRGNRAAKFILSLSLARFRHARGANARKFVEISIKWRLPKAQAVRAVSRIVDVWTADRQLGLLPWQSELKAATTKIDHPRKGSPERGLIDL